MTDLIEILREEAKWGNTYSGEILARIEKLEAALLAVKLTSVDFVAVTIAVEALEGKDD